MCGLKPSLYTYANMFLLVSQSGQLKHHHTRREKKNKGLLASTLGRGLRLMLTLLLSHLLTQAKIFFHVKGNHCFNCNVFDVASRFLKCNSFSFWNLRYGKLGVCARSTRRRHVCVCEWWEGHRGTRVFV